jgi:ABC-type Fe3+-hydroxamate transport system substrate-binding protein
VRRIVSLVPSITELVCALGLAESLVGRTGFCIHPKEALKAIPKVGGTKSVSLAKVRALRPTHVIVNVDENTKETADALAEFVPNVIVTHPLAPLDNLTLYRQIGDAFGAREAADGLCARFKAEYGRVLGLSFERRQVLYLVWKEPWMTVSRDTYISRMLALFGMQTRPATASTRYPKLKDLNVAGVEMILLSTEPYRFRGAHVEEVERQTGRRTHLIDGEMTSWYGPRAIAGLRYLSDFASAL